MFKISTGGLCTQRSTEGDLNVFIFANSPLCTPSDDIMRNIKESSMTMELFLQNYARLVHYMGLSLDVFPRVFNALKDWVTADEAYIRWVFCGAQNGYSHSLGGAKYNCRSLQLTTIVAREDHDCRPRKTATIILRTEI